MSCCEGWANDPTCSQQKRAKPTYTDPQDDMRLDSTLPIGTTSKTWNLRADDQFWHRQSGSVAHQCLRLNVSDGSIKPLSSQEEKELREHINSGHVKKSNLCKGCLLSEGPRKLHKRIRDVAKATHVLHIDIAGPYIESHEVHHHFLVGALRLPDRPLMIDVRLLKTRTSMEVCAALERMTSFFESLSFGGFEITDSPRIKRLQSDKAKEFTAL